MPRKRTGLERQEKVDEILEIAERQLAAGGFEALSVAAVARELGVAPNAVRWYFPSRAELFVETLRRMLYAIAARKPERAQERDRILWWGDELASLHRHRAVLQQHATSSKVVGGFVRELDGTLERMLRNAFHGHVHDEDLLTATATFRATVDGTHAEGLSRADRHRVLSYALDCLWTR